MGAHPPPDARWQATAGRQAAGGRRPQARRREGVGAGGASVRVQFYGQGDRVAVSPQGKKMINYKIITLESRPWQASGDRREDVC